MPQAPLEFLPPERARYLVEMAEQAREALRRFAGHSVDYDSVSLQMLDEWIERHLRQFPSPSPEIRLLWVTFLGEIFRRRHSGEWVLQQSEGDRSTLAVLCPVEGGGLRTVDVSGQVSRRIGKGMSNSLAYFYLMTSIQLKTRS